MKHTRIQGDQLYMTVDFYYLVKCDLSTSQVCFIVHSTSHFLQVTRITRQCLSGRIEYNVGKVSLKLNLFVQKSL